MGIGAGVPVGAALGYTHARPTDDRQTRLRKALVGGLAGGAFGGLTGALASREGMVSMEEAMGRVDAAKGVNHADFQALLKLLDHPNMNVKVSGIDRIAKDSDYTQGIELAKVLVDRFTEKCVWGTDWPHPNHHHIPHDEILVDAISQIADSSSKLEHIMVSNAEKFYRFTN